MYDVVHPISFNFPIVSILLWEIAILYIGRQELRDSFWGALDKVANAADV